MTEKVIYTVQVHSTGYPYESESSNCQLCNKVYQKLLLAAVPVDPEPNRVDIKSGDTIELVFEVLDRSTPLQVQKKFAKYWNDHIEPIFTGYEYYKMQIKVT